MKKYLFASLLILLVFFSFSASAQRYYRRERYNDRDNSYAYRYDRHEGYRYDRDDYRFGPRLGVNVLASLPFGAVMLSFGNHRYHYYGGNYYSPYGSGYMMVPPPPGIIVPSLPPYCSPVIIGSRTYYNYDNVYYSPLSDGRYEVIERPYEGETSRNSSGDSQISNEYQKVMIEGKTYYKRGDHYYKANIDNNGEVSYSQVD
jgi:hypothetical protein